MDINMLFKSQIIKIDEDNNVERTGTNIIYRIINFNNMYFFAQEITTGCIFPLYCFKKNSHNNDTRQNFNSFSYITKGSYYIFSSISGSEKIFEYTLYDSEHNIRPSIEEVNAYLEKNEKNREWQKTLQSMEAENEYHCDINLIKEKIAILRETSNISIVDNDELKPKYEKYIPSIDIKEIEELGYDLSKQNNLCNLIGRDKEQKECIKTLSIRGKSVLLVGESGSGKPKFINEKYFNTEGVAYNPYLVIDVGINRDANNKLCGDVDREQLAELVPYTYVTHVPGGVGLLTRVSLLQNVVAAYKLSNK